MTLNNTIINIIYFTWWIKWHFICSIINRNIIHLDILYKTEFIFLPEEWQYHFYSVFFINILQIYEYFWCVFKRYFTKFHVFSDVSCVFKRYFTNVCFLKFASYLSDISLWICAIFDIFLSISFLNVFLLYFVVIWTRWKKRYFIEFILIFADCLNFCCKYLFILWLPIYKEQLQTVVKQHFLLIRENYQTEKSLTKQKNCFFFV